MDGANVNEAFSRIAQNFLQMQNNVDITSNLPNTIAGATGETPTGKKKFNLDDHKTKHGASGKKCAC